MYDHLSAKFFLYPRVNTEELTPDQGKKSKRKHIYAKTPFKWVQPVEEILREKKKVLINHGEFFFLCSAVSIILPE